ncbi:MAG: hypothetical protein H8E28_15795 [Anaerolineae bacterium]|nr:hypothetical protein [Anaerolineae bacterium]
MKRIFLILTIMLILSLACSLSEGAGDSSHTPAPQNVKGCGDGTCGGPENPKNCPEDCAASPTQTEPSPSGDQTAPLVNEQNAVVSLGIMVHLEGWDDDLDQAKFERHVQLMRDYATLFENYGAKLTWESKDVTEGILRWGDNVLLEMEQRGHGIGVHADIGGQKRYDCNHFAQDLRTEKEQLESLGVTVRHVSGIVSHCDWVEAASEAGYLFTTGQVAYAVMSMPIESRPLEYRDCPSPSACHDTFPTSLEDRLHPWRMNSGADWLTHNPNGELVILASSGGLTCLEEEVTGQTPCDTYTEADIEYFFHQLDQAIALAEPGQVNIFYVSWSLGSPLDTQLLEIWLQRIMPYVASGQVAWKTLPEMFDSYIDWEARQ